MHTVHIFSFTPNLFLSAYLCLLTWRYQKILSLSHFLFVAHFPVFSHFICFQTSYINPIYFSFSLYFSYFQIFLSYLMLTDRNYWRSLLLNRDKRNAICSSMCSFTRHVEDYKNKKHRQHKKINIEANQHQLQVSHVIKEEWFRFVDVITEVAICYS